MERAIEKVRAFSNRIFHNHCWYCGTEVVKHKKLHKKGLKTSQPKIYWNTKTSDHLIARSNGGGKSNNLVPSCLRCNIQKASLTVEEFRIIFFGVHGGLFWGEQLALKLEKRCISLPQPIELNNTTGCIEQYECNMNKLDCLLRDALDLAFFEKVFLQENKSESET